MKYCRKCGAKMSDDALFCSKCGCKVTEPEEFDEHAENADNKDSGNAVEVAAVIYDKTVRNPIASSLPEKDSTSEKHNKESSTKREKVQFSIPNQFPPLLVELGLIYKKMAKTALITGIVDGLCAIDAFLLGLAFVTLPGAFFAFGVLFIVYGIGAGIVAIINFIIFNKEKKFSESLYSDTATVLTEVYNKFKNEDNINTLVKSVIALDIANMVFGLFSKSSYVSKYDYIMTYIAENDEALKCIFLTYTGKQPVSDLSADEVQKLQDAFSAAPKTNYHEEIKISSRLIVTGICLLVLISVLINYNRVVREPGYVDRMKEMFGVSSASEQLDLKNNNNIEVLNEKTDENNHVSENETSIVQASEVTKVEETSETSHKQEKQELSNNDSNNPKETLLDFSKLIETNPDTAGWIRVPNTVIDYVVVKPPEDDPEYYVTRDFYGDQSNYGTIFLDSRSQLDSKNMILHGHHMQDGRMFSGLKKYLDIDFYKTTPTFTFNTIYEKNDWKVISVFKTNTLEAQGEVFNYLRGSFESDCDFLDFVYNLRVRSVIDCPVSVNENDTLVTLSTPCYDMEDFRLVIVARRVRDGEDASVDVKKAKINSQPLYPDGWYNSFGGTKPTVTSFQDAFNNNKINWYDGNSTWKSDDDNKLQKILTEEKENAKRMLRESYNKNDYETEQQQEIESIINDYTNQIDRASTAAKVNELYADALSEIKSIKTKKQIEEENASSIEKTVETLYSDRLFYYNDKILYTSKIESQTDFIHLFLSDLGNSYIALPLPDYSDAETQKYTREINIDSFLIVDDIVYFTDQEPGSAYTMPARLYKMKLDGSDVKPIVSNVDVGFCYKDGNIYFSSRYSLDRPDSGESGIIYAYNISTEQISKVDENISFDRSNSILSYNKEVEFHNGIYFIEKTGCYRKDTLTGEIQLIGYRPEGGQS